MSEFIEEISNDKIIDKIVIGRVYAGETEPTTVFMFKVIIDKNIEIEIGEIVGVVDKKLRSIIVGMVDSINYLSISGDKFILSKGYEMSNFELETKTEAVSTKLVTVRFLRRIGEYENAFLGVKPGLPVYRMDSLGILNTLEINDLGIPIGLLALPSTKFYSDVPIHLDPEYLLGPEAAHFNMGGQSGYGKTSFILVLLKAIECWAEKSEKNVGIVLFNVKKDDLLYLDQKNDELTNDDLKIYNSLNIPAKPFKKVVFYATKKKREDDNLATLRDSSLETKEFHWEWPDIQHHIKYAIGPHELWDDIQEFALQVMREENLRRFSEVFQRIEEFQPEGRFNIRTASWGKFNRIIRGIYTKNSGLLGLGSHPIPYKDVFKENNLLVIDINEIFFQSYTQRLIFGKVIADLRDLMEKGDLGLDYLIIVTDELGRYAQKNVDSSLYQIRETIQDISERGRSLKITLFGIEQYPSTIADNIIGNVATLTYARMKSLELSNQLYRGLSSTFKEIIPRLMKSIMVIDHDNFPEPILVKFPRSPCATKKSVEFINKSMDKNDKKKKVKKQSKFFFEE